MLMMRNHPTGPRPNKRKKIGLAHRHQPIGLGSGPLFIGLFIARQKGDVLNPCAFGFPAVFVKVDDVPVRKGIAQHPENFADISRLNRVGLI